MRPSLRFFSLKTIPDIFHLQHACWIFTIALALPAIAGRLRESREVNNGMYFRSRRHSMHKRKKMQKNSLCYKEEGQFFTVT